jgi:hypothetical protein
VARSIVKPGPGLAAYLEASKSTEVLFGDIQKHVVAKAYQPDGRRTDVLHPSEMVKPGWCHRAAYYKLLRNGGEAKTTAFTRENIFQEGHNTHKKWQGWLTEMDRLAGDWLCRSCKHKFWLDARPQQCPRCFCRDLEYAEVELNAPALTIGGSTDGYCPDDNCLIEIKTLGLGSLRYEDPKFLAKYELEMEGRGLVVDLARMWRDFRRPLPSALRQGQLYLYLARHFEDLEVDRITFIYEFKADQQAKAFTLLYNEEFSEPLIEGAQIITDALKFGSPPVCNINHSAGCKSCLYYSEMAA